MICTALTLTLVEVIMVPWPYEIAVFHSKGFCILNATIDYGYTIQELFDYPDMVPQSRRRLCTIYGGSL